ncbi:MAG: hypothetical protein VXW31_07530 [Planctomycetota bacterium]|nr:hypothetical protein [Planctomycetota bacterium]
MKKHLLLHTGLLAPLAAAPAALALPTAQSAVEATEAVAPAQESAFGEPLTVNGVRIPDLEIKRFLVYGPGRNALDARKLQVLMDHERRLRRTEVAERILDEQGDMEEAALEAAVDEAMKAFDFDEEIITRRLAEEKASFSERYPTLSYETELRRAYRSGNWYRDQVRQTTEFDQLFFPDPPDGWPALSIEAINAGSPQVDLIADYQREYERRLQVSVETGEPIVPEQEMMMQILRDFVMGALWSLADVKTGVHGIPAELAMVIDGDDWHAEIRTEDVYSEMAEYFSVQEIEDAKLALALMEAGRQGLEKMDALLDIEAFRANIADQREQMKTSMFNFDFMALQGHGFPSSEAYEQHMYLVESYKKHKASALELTEEGGLSSELAGHMTVANGIMGLAKCHADTLLVSAFDWLNYEWRENGWEDAYERALASREQIDAHLAKLAAEGEAIEAARLKGVAYEGEPVVPFDEWWASFLRQKSEFWDPPLPATGKMPPEYGLKNFGAFRDQAMTRNDMKRALGETEYTHFLGNFAVVDQMFFNMSPGEVAGPFEGPHGFYIIYLRTRSAPTNPLNIRTDKHLAMLREDWLRKDFQNFCHEALIESETTGL